MANEILLIECRIVGAKEVEPDAEQAVMVDLQIRSNNFKTVSSEEPDMILLDSCAERWRKSRRDGRRI